MKQNTRFTVPPALRVEFIFSSCKGRKNRAQVPYLCSLPLCITPSFNGRCFYFENQITGRSTQYLAYVCIVRDPRKEFQYQFVNSASYCIYFFSFSISLTGSQKETRYRSLSPQVASVFAQHFHKSIKSFPLHNHKQQKLRIVVNKQPYKRRTLCGFCILQLQ